MRSPWSDPLDGERPPSLWRRTWLRFTLAGLAIIAISGGATAIATLNTASTLAHDIFPASHQLKVSKGVLAPVYKGKPQTFLVIGSDRRVGSKNLAERETARSDTMLLVHLDPEQRQTSIMSIPRDLLATIRTRSGHTYYPAKINAAYSIGSEEGGNNGGATLVAETIEELMHIQINAIVDVSFRGFIDVVDSLGCVYVNVDHRYFNENIGTPETDYSNINLQPGYYKLCKENALAYVRYRHDDSDFVRVARQQDFIRAVREQVKLANPVGEIERVSKAVGRAITSSFSASASELIELGELVAFSQDKPLRQVKFQYSNAADWLGGEEYVQTTPSLIHATVEEFLHGDRHASLPKSASTHHHRHGRAHHSSASASPASLGLSPTPQQSSALSAAPSLPFPLLYPELQAGPATPLGVRAYHGYNRQNKKHKAYIAVFELSSQGGYYDVEGMNWSDPPIVARPNRFRNIDGRRYMVFEDGANISVVAWREHGALYWVNNTLREELTNSQMFAIANSVKPLH